MIPIPEDLLEYTKSFLKMPQSEHRVPDKPIRLFGSVTSIILDRRGIFQSELVISHPGAPDWPGEHCHPDVDTVEIEVFNCKGLTRNGKVVFGPDFVVDNRLLVHLAPTDHHGAHSDPDGIALISCQKWLNGVPPSSVGLNWKGIPVHDDHARLLAES